MLSYLPLAHIVERTGVEGSALHSARICSSPKGSIPSSTDLQRARPTLFLSVPRLLLKFQQGVFAKMPKREAGPPAAHPDPERLFVKRKILRQLGLDTVRHAACGAAPLPPEILLWYRKLGLDLAEGYGMTETLITHLPAPGTVRPGYRRAALPGRRGQGQRRTANCWCAAR